MKIIRKLILLFTTSSQHFEGEQPGETTLVIVRGHTFSVWSRASFLLLIALLPFLFRALVPNEFLGVFWFGTSTLHLILWIMVFQLLTKHALNTVIITNYRIIENEQRGFFNRKVSELSLHNVQDVTAEMKGIIQTMLRFGSILIHTAAEEDMFVFEDIPHPERVKDAIMKATHANSTSTHS